jgi:Glycosyltransferase family 87
MLLSLASARGLLARVIGLRWLIVGGFDLAVPAAIAIVVGATAPQLGHDIGGIPFWVAWLAGTAAVVAVVAALQLRPRAPRLPGPGRPPAPATPARPRAAILGVTLVAGVVISWLLYDLWFWGHTNQLYDLNVYLGSASRWMEGGHPYLTGPLTAWPTDPRSDYLLYPPPLLPVFAALSKLPEGPISVGWIAFLVGCAYKAFRFLGLPRVWSLAMLAFPPVAIGFESGNVASLTFLLFTASVRRGGTLIVDWLFKTQTGLPTLWLIRERRWRGLLAGTAALVAIVLITLPLVGVDSWRAWFDGLGYRATSQANVPALYGFSAAAYLPGWAFVGLAVALVAVALLFRGRSGLAALGVATIFASPSLWPHGFAFALPAVLMLENGAAVWLVLGAGATGSNMWALFYLGLVAVLAARRLPSGHLHPLAGTDGPWPDPRRMIAVRARRSGLPPAEPAPPVRVSAPPVG